MSIVSQLKNLVVYASKFSELCTKPKTKDHAFLYFNCCKCLIVMACHLASRNTKKNIKICLVFCVVFFSGIIVYPQLLIKSQPNRYYFNKNVKFLTFNRPQDSLQINICLLYYIVFLQCFYSFSIVFDRKPNQIGITAIIFLHSVSHTKHYKILY